MPDPDLTTLALMAVAAFSAGWIDAVVGGGGLIQLPALLLGFPGATPAQLLATNKFGSIFGTATSSLTYVRRVRPDLRTALPMAGVAFLGAVGGALIPPTSGSVPSASYASSTSSMWRPRTSRAG